LTWRCLTRCLFVPRWIENIPTVNSVHSSGQGKTLKPNTIFLCLLSVWSRHVLGDTNLAFEQSSISAVSWGPGSLDVFGLDPDGKIWHKNLQPRLWLAPEGNISKTRTRVPLYPNPRPFPRSPTAWTFSTLPKITTCSCVTR
jgi:hypothetical protein